MENTDNSADIEKEIEKLFESYINSLEEAENKRSNELLNYD